MVHPNEQVSALWITFISNGKWAVFRHSVTILNADIERLSWFQSISNLTHHFSDFLVCIIIHIYLIGTCWAQCNWKDDYVDIIVEEADLFAAMASIRSG